MRRPTAYRMLADSEVEPAARAGTVVYDFLGSDLGLSRTDSRTTGVPYVSVTLQPSGGTPSFTVPVSDLRRLETIDRGYE